VYAVRGLRQAALMLVGAACVALAVAAVWFLVWEGDFRAALGITLMVIAALLALTGSNFMSRSGSAGERAMMGLPPENEDPDSGSALAPVGVFLFVALPLFVAGGFLYGTG
jgi:hypothetical protein